MQPLGKIIAGICAVLFVVTGVMTLLLFNVERRAFSPATYKQALANQKLYERMPSVLAAALATSVAENPSADPYLKAISQDEWEKTIASILPPEEWKALTDNALDSVFDYLNGKAIQHPFPCYRSRGTWLALLAWKPRNRSLPRSRNARWNN